MRCVKTSDAVEMPLRIALGWRVISRTYAASRTAATQASAPSTKSAVARSPSAHGVHLSGSLSCTWYSSPKARHETVGSPCPHAVPPAARQRASIVTSASGSYSKRLPVSSRLIPAQPPPAPPPPPPGLGRLGRSLLSPLRDRSRCARYGRLASMSIWTRLSSLSPIRLSSALLGSESRTTTHPLAPASLPVQLAAQPRASPRAMIGTHSSSPYAPPLAPHEVTQRSLPSLVRCGWLRGQHVTPYQPSVHGSPCSQLMLSTQLDAPLVAS